MEKISCDKLKMETQQIVFGIVTNEKDRQGNYRIRRVGNGKDIILRCSDQFHFEEGEVICCYSLKSAERVDFCPYGKYRGGPTPLKRSQVVQAMNGELAPGVSRRGVVFNDYHTLVFVSENRGSLSPESSEIIDGLGIPLRKLVGIEYYGKNHLFGETFDSHNFGFNSYSKLLEYLGSRNIPLFTLPGLHVNFKRKLKLPPDYSIPVIHEVTIQLNKQNLETCVETVNPNRIRQ